MKIRKIDVNEIEGFRLGNAENKEAGTGCTVIISEEGAVGGVDVRGGAPATRETDLLKSENTVETLNAVVLSGGSAFGLEAASGVMKALAEKGVGFRLNEKIVVPIVAGASLYDLEVGSSDVFPDLEMGREAVEYAYEFGSSPMSGNVGAGTGASCGKMLGMHRAMKTGLGSFACSDDVIQVGAIAAVNACADIYNGAGNIIAGLRSEDGSSIYGTINVLKGMIRPAAEPEFSFDGLKPITREEKPKTESDTAKSEIADAIKAAYEKSARTDAETPAVIIKEEKTAAGVISESISDTVTTEPAAEASAVAEPVSEPAPVAVEDLYLEIEPVPHHQEGPAEPEVPVISAEELTPAEVPEPEQSSEPETAAEPEPETVEVQPAEPEVPACDPEPAAEPEPEPLPEPETVTEPENPEEPDPYELSEYEKADMGYDLPFNTTIACLITNAKLTKSQANKLASILHDAFARAIKPVHSTFDGDTIFVMSTCKQDVNFDAFAALATDVMQYAIIDGATSAEGAFGLPAARDMIHK